MAKNEESAQDADQPGNPAAGRVPQGPAERTIFFQSAVDANVRKLDEMITSGAPAAEIALQRQKIEALENSLRLERKRWELEKEKPGKP